ncbi:MAG: conjugal transfer protein TraH [Sutterella sp.]|nr:conjugal transfer protein TraH [Sutterella sp.]
MIKMLFVVVPTFLCVQTAGAGFVKDYFDATQAMSNVTEAGVREAGAVSTVTGGGFVYRTPRTDFVPFSVTPPSLKAGCGGIDLFLGAFSIPSREEFVSFLKSVGTALPGLAFQLALQTMAPDLNEQVGRYADLIRSYTNRYTDSCEAARALLDNTGATEHLTRVVEGAKNALRSDGTVADQSEADRRVRDNGEKAIAASPIRKDSGGNVVDAPEINLTWALLSGGKLGAADFDSVSLRETMMTLLGTTIFTQEGKGENAVLVAREIAGVDLLPVLFNETGKDASLVKLTCDEAKRCLSPERKPMYDTDLVAELKEAADHYLTALKSRDASLVTDDEMLFLASVSSVPLLRILNLASVARYEGLAADIVNTYVEAAAYEALVGALEALTSDIRRVMGSSSATTLSAEHAKHVKALVLRISDVEESLALRRDKVVQAMNRAAAFVTQLDHIEKSLKSNAALDVTELTEGGVR